MQGTGSARHCSKLWNIARHLAHQRPRITLSMYPSTQAELHGVIRFWRHRPIRTHRWSAGRGPCYARSSSTDCNLRGYGTDLTTNLHRFTWHECHVAKSCSINKSLHLHLCHVGCRRVAVTTLAATKKQAYRTVFSIGCMHGQACMSCCHLRHNMAPANGGQTAPMAVKAEGARSLEQATSSPLQAQGHGQAGQAQADFSGGHLGVYNSGIPCGQKAGQGAAASLPTAGLCGRDGAAARARRSQHRPGCQPGRHRSAADRRAVIRCARMRMCALRNHA